MMRSPAEVCLVSSVLMLTFSVLQRLFHTLYRHFVLHAYITFYIYGGLTYAYIPCIFYLITYMVAYSHAITFLPPYI